MHTIIFPGLGLEFYVSKIAIQIGNIGIHWYAIFIVLAFIIGLYLAKRKDGLYDIKYENIVECFLLVIPIALICARLYYCVFKIDYYIQSPLKILDLRTGGLAIYGGIIGGAITCYIYCKKKKIKLLDFLDYIVPYLSLGQAIGRWGNFVNIEAYGTTTTLPWRMGIIENGNYIEVHPTFLYESMITFIIFICLIKQQKNRKYSGQITYTYLIMYSFARIFIEGVRSDSLMLYNLKISQILSIIIFAIFCSILVYNNKKYKKTKVNEENCQKTAYKT